MMELDNIVVICLAVLFFGGIIYLALKERKQEGDQTTDAAVPSQPETTEPPKTHNIAKEGRKKRKRRNR